MFLPRPGQVLLLLVLTPQRPTRGRRGPLAGSPGAQQLGPSPWSSACLPPPHPRAKAPVRRENRAGSQTTKQTQCLGRTFFRCWGKCQPQIKMPSKLGVQREDGETESPYLLPMPLHQPLPLPHRASQGLWEPAWSLVLDDRSRGGLRTELGGRQEARLLGKPRPRSPWKTRSTGNEQNTEN